MFDVSSDFLVIVDLNCFIEAFERWETGALFGLNLERCWEGMVGWWPVRNLFERRQSCLQSVFACEQHGVRTKHWLKSNWAHSLHQTWQSQMFLFAQLSLRFLLCCFNLLVFKFLRPQHFEESICVYMSSQRRQFQQFARSPAGVDLDFAHSGVGLDGHVLKLLGEAVWKRRSCQVLLLESALVVLVVPVNTQFVFAFHIHPFKLFFHFLFLPCNLIFA